VNQSWKDRLLFGMWEWPLIMVGMVLSLSLGWLIVWMIVGTVEHFAK
jgi:uncharacterized integral membrane protein